MPSPWVWASSSASKRARSFDGAGLFFCECLEDAHKLEHDHNDYDGDNQTENTAHSRSLQDVSDDASTQRAMHNIK